ncbi:MAG: FAD-dependent oxidoreductase, partial [Chloroflexota bacterium]
MQVPSACNPTRAFARLRQVTHLSYTFEELESSMNIAIIGAGYGGMAAAYDLRKAGHKVTIFESADFVGGLASGFKEPHWDWSVEKF